MRNGCRCEGWWHWTTDFRKGREEKLHWQCQTAETQKTCHGVDFLLWAKVLKRVFLRSLIASDLPSPKGCYGHSYWEMRLACPSVCGGPWDTLQEWTLLDLAQAGAPHVW